MSDIMFNVVGILLVVGLGTFAVVFVLDMLLAIFAHKYNGLIFHRQKKADRLKMQEESRLKKEAQKTQTKTKEEKVEKAASTVKETSISPLSMPTITPFLEMEETNEKLVKTNSLSSVDFDKAVEEQKELQRKLNGEEEKPTVTKLDKPLFETNKTNAKVNAFLEEDEEEEEEDEEEDDISGIIADVQKLALEEIEEEEKQKTSVVEKEILEDEEEAQPEPVVVETKKPEIKDVPKGKVVRPKLIYKTIQVLEPTEKEVVTEKTEEKVEVLEVVAEPTKEEIAKQKEIEKHDISELRKIRQDITSLRLNAKRELKDSTEEALKQKQQEIIEFEESVRGKLTELESLKLYKATVETEKEALMKTAQEVKAEKDKLSGEIENLEKELATLKNTVGIVDKPFYSKEYYELRYSDLQEQLKEAQKELRLNRREFNPLKRMKKIYDRDIVKLRRKEAVVAKQKLKLYGVNNPDDIDPDKLKKLQDEVEVLTNLKDSVHSCEIILKQNKDRYPVLEKANKLYTKHVKNLQEELERVQRAVDYYVSLENKIEETDGDKE